MKNYKEMADAVFRRRDEYAASLKRKKKIALNASLSLCAVCLATLGAFGIWKSGVLEPDPSIIGTKPQYITEATDPSKHILGSNATSEGIHSENTQIISGNTKPDSTSNNEVEPSEAAKPQENTAATDPVENSSKPAQMPTLPILPALPQQPNAPIVIPTLPPTVTEPRETKPNIAVPDATSATDGNAGSDSAETDTPQTNKPTRPSIEIPPTNGSSTQSPSTNVEPTAATSAWDTPPDFAVPDEPTAVPEETVCATEAPMASEPCCTEPTESLDAPSAENETVSISGKVVDQYGNPVKGAKVALYYNKTNYFLAETNANGYFEFISEPYVSGIYVKQFSAPSGYTSATNSVYLTKADNYIVFVCTKN